MGGAAHHAGPAELTDRGHWDRYWEGAAALPAEVTPDSSLSAAAILGVLDEHAGRGAHRSVLEIGGAPGAFAAHLQRRFGHEVTVLDNSPVGVELTRRNFELLNVDGHVLERDLFSAEQPIPQFDVAFSLGLIEHFGDTESVVRAHLAYVKPGGTLIIGCPNLLGVNGVLMRQLSPSVFDWHNPEAMDIRRWANFERSLGLSVRFRDYIAGFQPAAFWRYEKRSTVHTAVARGLGLLGRQWHGPLARRMSRLNSRRWSYYAIAVYEKPAGS